MKKTISYVILASVSLVLLLGLVYAAGTSTGSSDSDDDSPKAPRSLSTVSDDVNDNATENVSVKNKTMLFRGKNCEIQGNLTSRIRCRLEQRGIEGLNVTEESCRVLANPKNCMSLYAKVASCYKMDGVLKDQCFKRIAGFVGNKIRNQSSANNHEALRNYIIFLLYNLQEKVEKAYEDGNINETQTADTVALIVKIKQDILTGKTKADIKPEIQELRSKLEGLKI